MTNENFLDAFAEAIANRLESMLTERCRLMDMRRAAEFLGMTEDAVYTHVSRGTLKPVRIDSRNRFDIRDLKKLIEDGKKE